MSINKLKMASIYPETIKWLSEEENPSVRYFTLLELLDKNQKDKEVSETRNAIMTEGVVPRILARQNEDGYWGIPEDFYMRSKYRGTVWTILVLAELGADGSDERIRKAVEFVLRISQDRKSGAFAIRGTVKNGGNHSAIIPCLTGNMVYSFIKLGYLDDPRVQGGINWLAKYQRFDDKGADEPPKEWPYSLSESCWGKHTCSMGAIKVMKALTEIPEKDRSMAVRETIESGAEYFLKHHIYKRSHKTDQLSKPSWIQFGFPLMYQTDALEILGILVKLGYRDHRMQEAIDLLISKQDVQGRWVMGKSHNSRFLISVERDGKQSKWVTLGALKVLKLLGGSTLI